MEAWIKYNLNENTHNYTRFGKEIPHQEVKIDICKYFGCNLERAEYIARKLQLDPKVKFKLHKPAGNSGRSKVEKIEKEAEKKVVEEKKKEIDKKVTNEVKTKEIPTIIKKQVVGSKKEHTTKKPAKKVGK
jgi:hypothetical protein